VDQQHPSSAPATPVAPLTSNVTDVALVFEGGGMRGSYTAGVVTTLLSAGIHIDYVCGISAGASHTAHYLSRDIWRARRSFVEFSQEPDFGNLSTFARGHGLLNSQFIYEDAAGPGGPLPFDYQTYLANPASFRIGTFNASKGTMHYVGREAIRSELDLMRLARASSSMPLVMPPVERDGDLYYDGAIGPSGGIPLDAAQVDGYTKFLIVLSQERGFTKAAERFSAVIRRRFRDLPAVVEALEARAENYNRMREQVFDLEASGQAMVFVPDHMPVSNGERRLPRLQASYAAGYLQAQRELPSWREFLGL
jgi:predicted patatin/cPLA2 family phospholipase